MCKGIWIVATMAMLLGNVAAASEPGYVDAIDHPGAAEAGQTFAELEQRLHQDFDDICGDSFCAGEYSDYRPLRFRCSVALANAVIGQCIWTFAASEMSVAPTSGRLLVDIRTWRCPIALPKGLTLPQFLQALSLPSPLFKPLPGGQPIYESLIGCL